MNAKYIILFNPISGNKSAKKNVYQLDDVLANNDLNYVEMNESIFIISPPNYRIPAICS